MNRDKIIKVLEKQGYPEFMIDNTIKKIEAFAPAVATVFAEWLENGSTPQLEVENYSYISLIDKFKMKPIGAFITLDWLIRDSEAAKKSLKNGIK